nr:hypothetical protein [uncultured Acetatifactor sp.]
MRITGIGEKYYLIAPEGLGVYGILEVLSNYTGMRKDSFADMQVKRIFSDLFRGAVDLKACYRKYYIKEYDTFREFLYQKETLEYGAIDSMELREGEALWELKYTINGYNVRDLIGYENENLPLFNDFLEGIPI